ncbi:MAG: cobalt transporter [Deltaproteobacteria bacterium]|nr:cobalt transporter [Deltaproteobacteria bacterium]
MVIWLLLTFLWMGIVTPVFAANWSGVDETVVEHYAREYGRPGRAPYINTDKGDMLLFVFTLAGSVGGFIAGYNWRRFFRENENGAEEGETTRA